MRVAVDAMGGDYAPAEIVRGAIDSALDFAEDTIVLVGRRDEILRISPDMPDNIEIYHTDEFIGMDEKPADAIRTKKNSSMAVAANMVKTGECDAIVSAGNTGALLQTSTLVIGRIKGIKRPGLATYMPTRKGYSILIDSGANAECKLEYIQQFARMGSVYVQCLQNIEKPRIGLMNIGTERGKGNPFYQKAYEILSSDESINFIGNIEPRGFFSGVAEVAVADGFEGNMFLKSAEAAADLIFAELKEEIRKNMVAKVMALALKPVFKALRQKLDHSEHGGALLLGLKGICIKSHGRAEARTIYNAVKLARKINQQNMIGRISHIVENEVACDYSNTALSR